MAHLGHQHPVATYRHLFDDDGAAVRDALDASMLAAASRALERRRTREGGTNVVSLAAHSSRASRHEPVARRGPIARPPAEMSAPPAGFEPAHTV